MVTKGIITKLATPTNNYYKVKIPIFKSAGITTNGDIVDATLSYQPGIQDSYNIGDVVYITFEDNLYTHPVIIGKLRVTSNKAETKTGAANVETISATQRAVLPKDTTVDGFPLTKVIDDYQAGIGYFTLLKDVSTTMQYSTSEVVVGTWIDNKKIYKRTFRFTSAIIANQFVEIGDIGFTVDAIVKIEKVIRNSAAPYWFADNWTNSFFIKVDKSGKIYIYSINENWNSPDLAVTVYYTKS